MSLVLLVRHGQASFGTDDYDRLSPLGEAQGSIVGADLGKNLSGPVRVVAGTMRRQQQTAAAALAAAGWDAPFDVDPGWNEYDGDDLVQALGEADPAVKTDSRVFQSALEQAQIRWAAGHHESDYRESYQAFGERTEAALTRLHESLSSGEVGIAFTSGGVIGYLAARLIGAGAQQWIAFNRVAVNASITKLVIGRSGVSLVSFNEHGHLPADRVSYR